MSDRATLPVTQANLNECLAAETPKYLSSLWEVAASPILSLVFTATGQYTGSAARHLAGDAWLVLDQMGRHHIWTRGLIEELNLNETRLVLSPDED